MNIKLPIKFIGRKKHKKQKQFTQSNHSALAHYHPQVKESLSFIVISQTIKAIVSLRRTSILLFVIFFVYENYNFFLKSHVIFHEILQLSTFSASLSNTTRHLGNSRGSSRPNLLITSSSLQITIKHKKKQQQQQ